MNEQKDFSILFKSLEDAKKDCDYLFLEEAMQNTEILKDPIEKLQEIVMDSETVNYSVLITA
jgi:hypothetical protein